MMPTLSLYIGREPAREGSRRAKWGAAARAIAACDAWLGYAPGVAGAVDNHRWQPFEQWKAIGCKWHAGAAGMRAAGAARVYSVAWTPREGRVRYNPGLLSASCERCVA